jgi:hypothetical protein
MVCRRGLQYIPPKLDGARLTAGTIRMRRCNTGDASTRLQRNSPWPKRRGIGFWHTSPGDEGNEWLLTTLGRPTARVPSVRFDPLGPPLPHCGRDHDITDQGGPPISTQKPSDAFQTGFGTEVRLLSVTTIAAQEIWEAVVNYC